MAQPVSQGGIDYQDGGFSSGGASYPLAGDLGELAARLGSVITHNREGNVIFIETFEHGLSGWSVIEYGTGAEVKISNEKHRSSGYSCKITAGSDDARQARMTREFPAPQVSRCGLEASWIPQTNMLGFYMALVWVDGATEHQFYLKYSDATHTLEYYDENGDFVAFVENIDLAYGDYPVHTFKLVVNIVDSEYMRVMVNNTEYDLSGISGYSFSQVETAHLRAEIYTTSEVGANQGVWVDDIILTHNEPTRE